MEAHRNIRILYRFNTTLHTYSLQYFYFLKFTIDFVNAGTVSWPNDVFESVLKNVKWPQMSSLGNLNYFLKRQEVNEYNNVKGDLHFLRAH